MAERGYWSDAARRLSRRRLIVTGAAGAGAAALLTACGGKKAQTGGGTSGGAAPGGTSASAGTPKQGGRLGLISINTSNSLNPVTDVGQRLNLGAIQVYDHLVSGYPGKDYVLEAAASVEQPDTQTVIFKLKPGMVFQNRAPVNGRAVTADDVVKSEIYTRDDPKSYNTGFQSHSVQSMEAPDDQTVVFKLAAPDPYLFSSTQLLDPGAQCIFPKELLDKFETMESAWQIGSGPYELVDYQPNARYTYRRSASYHEASKGLPRIDERVISVLTDPAAQESAFRSGQIDILGEQGGLQPNSLADTLKKDMGARIAVDSYLSLSMISWNANATKPPFNDVRVREAMYRIINRQQYLDLLEQGKGKVPPGPLPAGLTDYQLDPKQTEKYFKQDPKAAKQLLDAAGFPYDKEVECLVIAQPRNNQGGEIYQQQAAQIGVKVKVVPLGSAEFLGGRMQPGTWETFIAFWPGWETPERHLRLEHTNTLSVHKYAGLKDPTIDKMIEQSEVTVDKDARIKLVKDIQIALLEKYCPMIYLEDWTSYAVRYTYLHDFVLNPATVTMQRTEAWLDK